MSTSKKVVLAAIAVAVAATAFLFVRSASHTRSRILIEKTKIITTEDGGTVIHIPIADLPREENKKLSTLESHVMRVPSKPEDDDPQLMTALLTRNGEIVVMTNIPYVHTLESLYFGRNVQLKGEWRKDAVIFGCKYRAFWVEDFKLAGE